MSSSVIRRRLRTGEWIEIERDVFAHASSPPSWDRQCMAATLLHPRAALSHSTAAARLGLDGFGPGSIHVTTPLEAHRASMHAVVHRSRHGRYLLLDGIRTTTFDHLVVQLAGSRNETVVRRALESGIHLRPSRQLAVERRIDALRASRLPGLGLLTALLDELSGTPPPASELERRMLHVLLQVPDIPSITRQAPAPWRSTSANVVDSVVEAWKLICEADGRTWHTRAADFERDRWRDAEALAHGYLTVRLTDLRLRRDVPAVIDQLAGIGDLRRARSGQRAA